MSSKKTSESKSQQDAGVSAESEGQDESQRQTLLHKEYETLTENLSTLKRRVEQKRKDNQFLQNEIAQSRIESKEYMSYMSERAEKRQKAILNLSDQSRKELEELQRQRQNMQDKHKEQSDELQTEILQMENQLALLNSEIVGLKEVETLQQQQSCRITELEKELTTMQCQHSESLVALKADFIKKKKSCEQQAVDTVHAFTISANKEASRYLTSYINKEFQEKESLHEEHELLFQRALALKKQQDTLQTHRQKLLLEQKSMQKTHAQYTSLRSKYRTSAGANNNNE
ncbi:BICD family-like cargo adapter 1 [Puntigrus tetrazona]|uniref:BICD family-like cargo adapter 1 n=1 Tax=Puntigrus tetrazona TaxID=1606681 RepID=UPI001C89A86A|nr:BICD family-like cargo adapter 1 [Puntigrus tetrazona]